SSYRLSWKTVSWPDRGLTGDPSSPWGVFQRGHRAAAGRGAARPCLPLATCGYRFGVAPCRRRVRVHGHRVPRTALVSTVLVSTGRQEHDPPDAPRPGADNRRARPEMPDPDHHARPAD